MKRKLLACITSLMLLLSILLVGNVGAHPIIVVDSQTTLFDRTRADWFAAEPSDPGNAMIARNSLGWGEFIFNDYKSDQRIITTTLNITRSTDIDWFSITADSTYASFLTKMDRINGALANPQVELMISVSTNQASGQVALPDTVGVTLTNAAAWEYVIQTNFNSNVNGNFVDPRIWSGPSTVNNCSDCEAQLTGASNGGVPGSFIEIKVPWSRIGGKPTPNDIRRFTLTTYYKGHDLNVIPNDGHPNSALIDVASTTQSTKAALDQGQINSYFDIHFDAGGEVFSPLLISEFNPNPSGSEPGPNGTEWIEIYNPPDNNVTVQLGDYKIGDTVNKTSGSEAILRFPAKTLNPGDIVIVARDKAVPPISTVPAAANLTIYNMSQLTLYGGTGLIGLDTKRDQLVLLDGRDTIADFVEYNEAGNVNPPFTNSVPYVLPPAGAPDGNIYSYERCPAATDTNDASVDFQQHDTFGFGGSPTPGLPCPLATGVDLNIQKIAQPEVVLAGSTVNFFIEWSNNGSGGFSSIVVTDTLPANVTFVSQSSKPNNAAFTQNGQNLSWNFPNFTTNAVSGTIVLTATVSPSAPANVPLVNTAGVRSNDPNRVEDAFKLGDNFAQASVTASKPDMAVSSTWPGGAPSNTDVVYTITYANNGTGAASNVIVTDTLPTGVTFLPTGSTPPTTISGQVLTWNRGDLDPGGSGTITVKVHINAPAPTPLTNVIQVSASPADGSTTDNTETRILVVGAAPDLRVSTTGWPTFASPGTQFCYTINYSYPNGALPANDVTIKDVLPFGLTLVSQTSSPALTFSADNNTLTWTRTTPMNIGQSGTIQVCVKVRPDVVVNSTVNNVVTISGSVDPDPNAGNNKETKPLTFDRHKLYLPFIRRA